MRTGVPSADRYVICSVTIGGRSGVPGAMAQSGVAGGGDPDVVAGGGAGVLGQDEPAPVVGHVDGVVGGGVAPVAEDERVGGRVGAEAVEADPAVEGLLAGRDLAGREAADVVEA